MTPRQHFLAGYEAARAGLDPNAAWREHQANGTGRTSAKEFHADLSRAMRTATEALGRRWQFSGRTVMIEVPSRLRSYKTERGVTISIRRDYRVPEAKYWPDGVIPADVKVYPDFKPSTAAILCDSPGYRNGRDDKAYLAWLNQRKDSPVYGMDGKPVPA